MSVKKSSKRFLVKLSYQWYCPDCGRLNDRIHRLEKKMRCGWCNDGSIKITDYNDIDSIEF